jgi:hypothetical protein
MTLQGVLAPSTVATIFYFASPYTLCASAHPAKDFLLLQHGEISWAKTNQRGLAPLIAEGLRL